MKVVISPRGFASYGEAALKLFEEKGIKVDYNQTGLPYSHGEFLERAKDADGLIVGVDQVDRELIDACPHLKVICKFGVGVDNIAVDYAEQKGILVGRTLGTNTNAVAEHVLALMFADAKKLFLSLTAVKEGKWNKPTGIELQGKTLGIIGFGSIGQRLAQLAQGIGMSILAYDMAEIDPAWNQGEFRVATFDEVLEKSDYLSLHIPLTKETKNLIGQKELKKMKETACLINTSRGGVVREEELLTALKNHHIRSAAFDVFSQEPPEEKEELLQLDQFLLTPHTGSRTEEAEERTCLRSASIVLERLLESREEE